MKRSMTGLGLALGLMAAASVPALGCGDDGGNGGDTGGAPGSGGAAGVAGGSGQGGSGQGGSGQGGTSASGNGAAGASGGGGGMSMGTPTPSGGELRNGICYPPAGPTREQLGGDVVIYVQTPGLLFGPIAHTTGVYYSIERDGLYRLAPGAHGAEQIAATPEQRYTPWIWGEHLYYRINDPQDLSAPGSVERLPLSDLSATPEPVVAEMPDDLAADATHFYATDHEAMQIYREPIGGGTREVVVDGVVARQLQIGPDGLLYYSTSPFDDQIRRVPVAGGAGELVVDEIFDLSSYIVAEDGIYWSGYYGLFFTPFGTPGEKQVIRPNDTSRFFGPEYAGLALSGDRIYWTVDDFPAGAVGWTKLDHSDCDTVIDGGDSFNRAALAEDGLYIGTFSSTSELYRVPRE